MTADQITGIYLCFTRTQDKTSDTGDHSCSRKLFYFVFRTFVATFQLLKILDTRTRLLVH